MHVVRRRYGQITSGPWPLLTALPPPCLPLASAADHAGAAAPAAFVDAVRSVHGGRADAIVWAVTDQVLAHVEYGEEAEARALFAALNDLGLGESKVRLCLRLAADSRSRPLSVLIAALDGSAVSSASCVSLPLVVGTSSVLQPPCLL